MDFEQKNNTIAVRNEVALIPANNIAVTNTPPHDYLAAATSNNTRRAYQSDTRHFIQSGATLPASFDDILRYLQHYAATLNPRTLERRLTAIKNWHLYQGFIDPTTHPSIRKTLSGIKNIHGKPKDKAPPLTLEILSTMVKHLEASSASKKGAPFGTIKRQRRWRHEGTVLGYIDEGKRFDQNAASIILKEVNGKVTRDNKD